MAQTVIIKVDVKDGEIDDLNQKLGETAEGVSDVSDATEDATGSFSRYSGEIRKSNPLVEKLNNLTGGVVNKLLDLSDAAKKSGIALRSAFIATGIGALVVAVGVLISYWDEIVDKVSRVNERLEAQLELVRSDQSVLQQQLDNLESQDELLEKQGKANESLQKQKVALVEQIQEQNNQEIRLLETQLKRLEATATEVGFWDSIKANLQFVLFGAEGVANAATELAAQRLKQINDIKEAIAEAKGDAIDLEIALFDIQNPQAKKEGVDKNRIKERNQSQQSNVDPAKLASDGEIARQEAIQKILDAFELKREDDRIRKLEIERERVLAELEQLGADEQAKAEVISSFDIMIEAEREKRRKKREKDLETQRKKELEIVEKGADAVIGIMGANTKAGKITAATMALINSLRAGTEVLANKTTLPEPFGTINKIASMATIIAAGKNLMKQIISVPVPALGAGAGVAGAGIGAGSSASIPVPQFNVVGGTGVNQLATAIGEQLGQPTRAFLVYDDIKTAEELERNAVNNSQV